MNVKLSKEFVIIYDNQTICRATDFDFEVNNQTIDITTLCSQGWKDLMVDGKEWRISFNGLVTRQTIPATEYSNVVEYSEGDLVYIEDLVNGDGYTYQSVIDENEDNNPLTDDGTNWIKVRNDYDGLLQDLKQSNAPIEIAIKSNVVGDKFEVGEGYITSLKVSGSVGDKTVFSGTVEGTEDLETFTITE